MAVMRRPLRSSSRSRHTAVAMAFVAGLGACGAQGTEETSQRAVTPRASAHEPAAEDGWEGRAVTGLATGYLSDVAMNQSGAMVAVGTVSTDEPAVAIWRSDDGVAWQEVFRQEGDPGEDDAFVGMPGAAVVHDGGFAAMFAACSEICRPVAVFSSDGTSWREGEVEVRQAAGAAKPAGHTGGAAGVVGAKRLIRASPDYTIQGAEILDIVAAGDRLVGVG